MIKLLLIKLLPKMILVTILYMIFVLMVTYPFRDTPLLVWKFSKEIEVCIAISWGALSVGMIFHFRGTIDAYLDEKYKD